MLRASAQVPGEDPEKTEVAGGTWGSLGEWYVCARARVCVCVGGVNWTWRRQGQRDMRKLKTQKRFRVTGFVRWMRRWELLPTTASHSPDVLGFGGVGCVCVCVCVCVQEREREIFSHLPGWEPGDRWYFSQEGSGSRILPVGITFLSLQAGIRLHTPFNQDGGFCYLYTPHTHDRHNILKVCLRYRLCEFLYILNHRSEGQRVQTLRSETPRRGTGHLASGQGFHCLACVSNLFSLWLSGKKWFWVTSFLRYK
jgi:hypothetical protein